MLRHTGARFLAGYDYMGQSPFLDIALEWDGDKTLQRKRSHVVDDLLTLVEAIGVACETDRSLMPIAPRTARPATLPEAVRALFDKPVVAVHLGRRQRHQAMAAGIFRGADRPADRTRRRSTSCWSAARMSRSLRRRCSTCGAAAGPAWPRWSGQTGLAALPQLLAACALYIGNDSGPKHIAAALGVPTIGIHSGVVDASEWGPIGRRAVALQRDMTCSPCYLANAEDCPRSLACLHFLEPSVVHRRAQLLLARPVAPRPVRTVHEAMRDASADPTSLPAQAPRGDEADEIDPDGQDIQEAAQSERVDVA